MPQKSMTALSLWQLVVGESKRIALVCGGTTDTAGQRLVDIGFREGQQITCVLQSGFRAIHVYEVRGATHSSHQQSANFVRIC